MMAVFIFKLIKLPPKIPIVLKMLHKMIQTLYEQCNMLGNENNDQIDFAHPSILFSIGSYMGKPSLLRITDTLQLIKVLSSLLYIHFHFPAIENSVHYLERYLKCKKTKNCYIFHSY